MFSDTVLFRIGGFPRRVTIRRLPFPGSAGRRGPPPRDAVP